MRPPDGTLPPDLLRRMDAYWRATNYLSVGQIYLYDNPLLKVPLELANVKRMLLGHWGTTPGQNFIYVHLNRVIQQYDLDMIYVAGPGHGGPAVVGNTYLEGTYTEVYPDISQDEAGLQKLFRQFSFPGGIPSHASPECPGSIHEGGELGYSLSHSFGAVFDNPDLIVACVVGDGEAETGPLATAWHSNKFLDPATDGAVLPILHLNGYKIANPTVLARITHEELEQLLRGYGWTPLFVEGDQPKLMHQAMAAALDTAVEQIQAIQQNARNHGDLSRPRWPMIVLKSPKGWTGPKVVDGLQVEGTFRAHQVPLHPHTHPGHLKLLEDWLRSYRPEELFDAKGCLMTDLADLAPRGDRRMGANPHANGGLLLRDLQLPDFRAYAVEVPSAGISGIGDTHVLGRFLRDVERWNVEQRNFRIFGPDETLSNGLEAVFEATVRQWDAATVPNDEFLAPTGRVMEMLSEHQCEGWLEGYLLTGRHGLFNCYEAFIHIVDSMFNQHAKWLEVASHLPWRRPIASLNYLLSSHVWRQDHNGFTHQDPGFLDVVVNKKAGVVRVYLPPDANCLLSVMDHCLRSRQYVNVVIAGKHPAPQWLTMDAAARHCAAGIGMWPWASNDQGAAPDVVMACCGDVPTLETLAAVSILRQHLPDLKIRVINVVDLMKLQPQTEHPHGLSDPAFDALFTTDRPIIFAFHAYPWLIHRLTYRRTNHDNLHVRGYKEEGTITTPFDMTVLNDLDRFHLVQDVVDRLPHLGTPGTVLKQVMQGKLVAHRAYIDRHGQDLPEIPELEVERHAMTSHAPPMTKPAADLKTMPLPDVAKQLVSSPDGLTQAEAQQRLAQYGPNEIAEKRTNTFLKFLTYFWGPIPWMIEGAVVLSGVVRHWMDLVIISVLLVSNAVVGFWEEHQAGNAIAALKAKLALKASVKRDSKWVNAAVRELVPGDVIHLRLGDIIPADARLLAGDPVEVDQSALTGESLPVAHPTGAAVYSGSIIRRGEIDAMVYATGADTYFGNTARLVQEAPNASHFQRAVLKIGNYLIILAAVLVTVIIVVAVLRGDAILTTVQFALVLLVAAIPVAMPTVLSVTMAVGARLLAKKQAIVTRLAAIEELAGVDVLCSDKTGTLTENTLTLGDPFCVNGTSAEQVILDAVLASRTEGKDTIDLAVIAGLKDNQALNGYQVVHFLPFDPVHKRTEAKVTGPDGRQFHVTKGAPQVILAMVANAGEVKASVEKAVNDFAGRGFRSLGVARANEEGKWQCDGVLPMFDPPRPQAKATIASAGQMGVAVKMVTGDQLAIARETARQLGLGTNILDASDLGDREHPTTAKMAEAIENADGFAEVFPEHKFHIVDVLQQRGHTIGMTGDGVNDAPALKKADCGIAVSGATDVARAAASIVLLAPGLSVVIDAIKESRKIFQRMNSYAIYRIAETLRVLLFMTVSIMAFNFYPVTAVMIVMLALLNDGAILSIAYDNVHFQDRPEAWHMRSVLGVATVLGITGVVAAFALFLLGKQLFHLDRAHLQTLMYLKLSVAGHLTIFLTRTRGPFWSIRPARTLWIAVLGTQAVATLIAVYGVLMTPLGWRLALFVWGYALLWALLNDRVKLLAYRLFDPVKAAPNAARTT